jgi:hypothetical protein
MPTPTKAHPLRWIRWCNRLQGKAPRFLLESKLKDEPPDVLLIAAPAQAQTEAVLYNFCSQPNCVDGASVANEGGLTYYGGNFYGETVYGGQYGYGTVFERSHRQN